MSAHSAARPPAHSSAERARSRERRVVILALRSVNYAHSLGAPEASGEAWVNPLQLLRRRLGGVVTRLLKGFVRGAAHQFRETFHLLGLDEQLDEGAEIGALGCVHGLLVPGRAPSFGHELHELVVAALAGFFAKVGPSSLDRLVSTAKPGPQLAVKPGELVAGFGPPMGVLLVECDPARGPRQRLIRLVVEQPSHALLQFRAHSRFSAVVRQCSLDKFIQSCRLGFISSCDNHDLIVSTERAPHSPS